MWYTKHRIYFQVIVCARKFVNLHIMIVWRPRHSRYISTVHTNTKNTNLVVTVDFPEEEKLNSKENKNLHNYRKNSSIGPIVASKGVP